MAALRHLLVGSADFDPGAEIAALGAADPDSGAVASFVGLVRGGEVRAMTLEHYPGMTESEIAKIMAEAESRWPLLALTVIHRIGRLAPGDRIVFVGVAARHRGDAIAATEFLIDWLKSKAPFWKIEETAEGERWVEARAADDQRAERWK